MRTSSPLAPPRIPPTIAMTHSNTCRSSCATPCWPATRSPRQTAVAGGDRRTLSRPAPRHGLSRNARCRDALAADFDRLAVLRDLPQLRSLGDGVRLLSLSLPCDARPRRFPACDKGHDPCVHRNRQRPRRSEALRPRTLHLRLGGIANRDGLVRQRLTVAGIRSAIHLGDEMARYRVRTATLTAAHRVRQSMDWQRSTISERAAATPSSPVQAAPTQPPPCQRSR